MSTQFTDFELLAYLDEGLPVTRMTAIEAALRVSEDLRIRTAELRDQREVQGHTVSEIWRRERLSCPTRHQLGSYLLGALETDLAQYVLFHLETVGCRYCAANIEDLRASQKASSSETTQRRQRFFESSAGHMRKQRERE